MEIKEYYRCIPLQIFHSFSLCILEKLTSFLDFFLILHDIPFSVRDLKEANFCVDDLKAPLFHSTMVSLWILDYFFRKDVEIDLLWNLVTHLFKYEPFLLNQGQLTEGQFEILCLFLFKFYFISRLLQSMVMCDYEL